MAKRGEWRQRHREKQGTLCRSFTVSGPLIHPASPGGLSRSRLLVKYKDWGVGSSQLRSERALSRGCGQLGSGPRPAVSVRAGVGAGVCAPAAPARAARHRSRDARLTSRVPRPCSPQCPAFSFWTSGKRDRCSHTLNYANRMHFINLWKCQVALTVMLNPCPANGLIPSKDKAPGILS